MLSRVARFLLTASAIAPVGLSYAWVAYTQGDMTVVLIAALVSFVTLVSGLLMLWYSRVNLEPMDFRPQSIEPADSEPLGFMIFYTLPLFTDRVASLNWAAWIPIVGMFSLVVWSGYGYHFNPLLSIVGWHFYKVTSSDGVTYVLVTRRHIRSASEALKVGQLTEYILLDLRR